MIASTLFYHDMLTSKWLTYWQNWKCADKWPLAVSQFTTWICQLNRVSGQCWALHTSVYH